MPTLPHLFERNREWARRLAESDPGFFRRLSAGQHPTYLWIGCSDSRVPASQVAGLEPGEVFVHRNIANLAVHSDLNFLSVLQYAVEVLEVGHVIVVGHHGCGGVRAALEDRPLGTIDDWLRPVRELAGKHRSELGQLEPEARLNRLCELNVLAQTEHLRHSPVLLKAWARGRAVEIHSWIYRLEDGSLEPLQDVVTGPPPPRSARPPA